MRDVDSLADMKVIRHHHVVVRRVEIKSNFPYFFLHSTSSSITKPVKSTKNHKKSEKNSRLAARLISWWSVSADITISLCCGRCKLNYYIVSLVKFIENRWTYTEQLKCVSDGHDDHNISHTARRRSLKHDTSWNFKFLRRWPSI